MCLDLVLEDPGDIGDTFSQLLLILHVLAHLVGVILFGLVRQLGFETLT